MKDKNKQKEQKKKMISDMGSVPDPKNLI